MSEWMDRWQAGPRDPKWECPWCGSDKPPTTNTEHREDEPRWQIRNPLKCVDCGEVGAPDDWIVDHN